jgi:acyl carrier protein
VSYDLTAGGTELNDFVLDTVARLGGLQRSELDTNSDLLVLGLDSVARVSLISEIEARFGIEFTTEQIVAAFETNGIPALLKLVHEVARSQYDDDEPRPSADSRQQA